MESPTDSVMSHKDIREVLAELHGESFVVHCLDGKPVEKVLENYSKKSSNENMRMRALVLDVLLNAIREKNTPKLLAITQHFQPIECETISLYNNKIYHGCVWEKIMGSRRNDFMLLQYVKQHPQCFLTFDTYLRNPLLTHAIYQKLKTSTILALLNLAVKNSICLTQATQANINGISTMAMAIQSNLYTVVEQISKILPSSVESTTEPNGDGCSSTMLVLACQEGYGNCAKMLLDAGAHPSKKSTGFSPLHAAIYALGNMHCDLNNSNYCHTIRLLCQHPEIDINELTSATCLVSEGHHVFHLAAVCDRQRQDLVCDMMNIILRHKDINLDHPSPVTQNTPLLFACHKQNFKVAALLIDAGADVSFTNNKGYDFIDICASRFQKIQRLSERLGRFNWHKELEDLRPICLRASYSYYGFGPGIFHGYHQNITLDTRVAFSHFAFWSPARHYEYKFEIKRAMQYATKSSFYPQEFWQWVNEFVFTLMMCVLKCGQRDRARQRSGISRITRKNSHLFGLPFLPQDLVYMILFNISEADFIPRYLHGPTCFCKNILK